MPIMKIIKKKKIKRKKKVPKSKKGEKCKEKANCEKHCNSINTNSDKAHYKNEDSDQKEIQSSEIPPIDDKPEMVSPDISNIISENTVNKSTLSPLIRSPNNRSMTSNNRKIRTVYHSPYQCAGLSPKERCFVISHCQARPTRYSILKALATDAINHNKVFSIYDRCSAVRKALLERGWVEKLPIKRMNLNIIKNGTCDNIKFNCEVEKLLLSNFVQNAVPRLIWTEDLPIIPDVDITKLDNTLFNKLQIDTKWTSKQGLCTSIKDNYWFYQEGVAEVVCPRTYKNDSTAEIDDFVTDYKVCACTSLLKWVLSMAGNQRKIFDEAGKISTNIIVFALNRCKEYLLRKQNKDIDKQIRNVDGWQWNAFLKKYYLIISREEVFQSDKQNKLSLYVNYAKFLLKEMYRFRPQLSCEGCHNIWIIKPTDSSRGRGIRLASKLGVIRSMVIKTHAKCVLQKYIEEPLLIYDTKFDIRQYYLVTCTSPLKIWMYKDCYLKFSSQKYSLRNFHEAIHLTNNAVQRKYENIKHRHKELPINNMWDLETFKSYLDKVNMAQAWNEIIYPGMKKSIVAVMLNCQESLTIVGKRRFELFGCDFVLDKGYKPWLIEINSNPDTNHTTNVTAKICPAVLTDIIKVIVDRAENRYASTGNFECIYHQVMTPSLYGTGADLVVRGYALRWDYFYKGNIQMQETYNNADISKDRDITAILKKMKKLYDAESELRKPPEQSNLIKQPESSTSHTDSKKDEESVTHVSQSEDELKMAVSDITKPVNELLEKIPSNKSYKNELSFTYSSNTSSKKWLGDIQNTSDVRFVRSHCDMNTTNKRDYLLNRKPSFIFSRLEDGPGSLIRLTSIKKEHQDKYLPST